MREFTKGPGTHKVTDPGVGWHNDPGGGWKYKQEPGTGWKVIFDPGGHKSIHPAGGVWYIGA
ncbi:hypothetical protein CN891_03285 [Bacillus toyonensis]|uniref:hypothetical protein n=1 Tax=Bacillus toyonensis TaxID=155322 RepID=UPI000BF05BAC|nr:hypothetical protein [Bacillus toyonensis]PEJ89561.1 hypothetical protein CN891_03285 [Bacillus toyonensis]